MPILWIAKLFQRGRVSPAQECRRAVAAVDGLLAADRRRRAALEKAQDRLRELAAELDDELVVDAVRRAISLTNFGLAEDCEWQRRLRQFAVQTSSTTPPHSWVIEIYNRLRDLATNRSAVIDAETRRYWRIIELFEDAAMHPAISGVEHRRAALARLAFFDIEAAESLRKAWVLAEASSRMRAVEHRRNAWKRVQALESVIELREDEERRRQDVHALAVGIRSATGVPGVGFWDVERLHMQGDVVSKEFFGA